MRPASLPTLAARVLMALVVTVAAGGLLSVLLVPFVVALGDTVEATREELFDRPPLPDHLPLAAEISTVHDRDGTRIADLSGPIRRETVPLERIPQVVIDAVIATEDDEFFEHTGVRHDAMVRAAARNVQAGGIAEGASTITQQYVRMALLDPEQTIDRKLHEIVWAVQLEERLEKEEILERYLNGVYLGQGVYGFGTAADHYFSRPIEELGLAEAALLAGTIRAPAVTNPVSGPEAAQQRRDVVIRQMQAQGLITDEEADAVVGTGIELEIAEPDVGEEAWTDLVKRLIYDPSVDLQPGLQEAVGDSVQERVDALFEGGLSIETTLDAALQRHARDTVAAYLQDPLSQPLGSIVSVEHATGAVRAVALGPHEFGTCPEDQEEPCELTQINPAVPGYGGSGRQSGSAFKPFVAAAALEAGVELDAEAPDEQLLDALEQLLDDPDLDVDGLSQLLQELEDADLDGVEGLEGLEGTGIEQLADARSAWYHAPSGEPIPGCGTPGEDDYAPRNFDDRDQGLIGMHEAMRVSSNVFFVKLARDIGIPNVVQSALAHGLVYSPNLGDFVDRMCSIALGSAELFPLEMVVGYGTWANDGVRCDPYVIERVLDREGEVLYQHEQSCEQVIDPEVAAGMRELLQEPVGSGGTAPAVGRTVGPQAHGKTGTTNNFVDAWFAGWAGELTTTSWIGFEEPRPLEDVTIGGTVHERVTGGGAPAQMWADFVAGPSG
jgi:membrane peptidoglycan carboxypeptidase